MALRRSALRLNFWWRSTRELSSHDGVNRPHTVSGGNVQEALPEIADLGVKSFEVGFCLISFDAILWMESLAFITGSPQVRPGRAGAVLGNAGLEPPSMERGLSHCEWGFFVSFIEDLLKHTIGLRSQTVEIC